MKKTIMLICSAGMSTSLLVKKMEEAAAEKKVEANIFAISASELDSKLEESIDCILLGPQVRFMLNEITGKVGDKNIKVSVIDMKDYGMMNGEKVLNSALELVGE